MTRPTSSLGLPRPEASASIADLMTVAHESGYAEGFHDLADTLLDTLPGMADIFDRSARDLCEVLLRNEKVDVLTPAEVDDTKEQAAFHLGCAHMARDIASVIRTALDVSVPANDESTLALLRGAQ